MGIDWACTENSKLWPSSEDNSTYNHDIILVPDCRSEDDQEMVPHNHRSRNTRGPSRTRSGWHLKAFFLCYQSTTYRNVAITSVTLESVLIVTCQLWFYDTMCHWYAWQMVWEVIVSKGWVQTESLEVSERSTHQSVQWCSIPIYVFTIQIASIDELYQFGLIFVPRPFIST